MEDRKRVLIVTQYFLPDITAAAYRMGDLYKAICKEYDVDVLTTFPHKSKQEVTEAEKNIFRVKVKSNYKNKYIKYLNEYFGFMFGAIKCDQIKRRKYDYVFVTSPPIFSLVAGCIIAKRKKAKLVIDIRDIWPDVLIDDGTLSEKDIIFKGVKALEKSLYKRADIITCVSKYMSDYIETKAGKKPYIIYNGISEYEKDDFLNDNSTEKIRSSKKLNVFYTGNLGFFQHLDVLLQSFCEPEIQRKFHLTIIGGGSRRQAMELFIKENSLSQYIEFIEPMKKSEMNKKVSKEADLLFLNLFDSSTLRRTIPSKLFDYFAFNLPIVYGIKGEGKELIEELGCGEAFEWDEKVSLVEALIKVDGNYIEYLKLSANNKNYVYEHYNRIKLFKEFWNSIV